MRFLLQILTSRKFWTDLIIMTLGMMIASAAVYYFLLPSKLVLGSITGLSIVVSELFAMLGLSVKVSVVVTLINAALLVMAWLLIGREFGAKTVYTALILGPMIEFLEWVMPYTKLLDPGTTSMMNDPWLDLVCFVLLLSLSQTVLFSINASTGGLDILAKIINKYLHFDIGASVTVSGALICCTAFAINPVRLVILGLVGTWLNGLVLDYFTAAFHRKKRVCIISPDSETIRQYIIGKMHRGCTLYNVTGGYNNEPHVEIQALLTKDEFADVMNFIKENDLKTFITAGDVSEIYGLWNRNRKIGNI